MKNHHWGLSLVAAITAISMWLAQTEFAVQAKINSLTIAILLGMLLGNSIYPKIAHFTHQGIDFAKGKLLRAGIVLYGFRITLQEIEKVGINGIMTDAIMLTLTFLLTCWLGIRYLKIDKQIVYLTAAGCSICGAAAVMASVPVVKAESHKTSVAIALVVIFGTLCMFLYPVLYPWLSHYLSTHQYGIYIGSSVHEVAQVYAASANINPLVADTAVISKMIRVMMLAPFLLCLTWYLARKHQSTINHKIIIPWFAIGFIGVAIFNSFSLLPASITEYLITLDNLLLMAAMSALGLTTQAKAIKQAGFKPLLLGAIICVWLIVGGFVVNVAMEQLWN